jgi:RNA polymerase sigma-70 factor (ECF subfamily)
MDNWQKLYDEHAPAVWRTAWRLLRDEHEAADCVQDAFCQAVRYARDHEIRNWRGLLIRLATRRSLDCLRGRIRRRRRETLLEPDYIADGPAASFRSDREQLAAWLAEALAQLPGAQSEAFCLRFIEDLNYEQIAEQMKTSVSNVGVLLHRARARLRQLLPAEAREALRA